MLKCQNWVFPSISKDVLDLVLRKKKKLTFDLYFLLKMSCQQHIVRLHWRKRSNEHAYKIMLLTVFFITHKRVKSGSFITYKRVKSASFLPHFAVCSHDWISVLFGNNFEFLLCHVSILLCLLFVRPMQSLSSSSCCIA